LPVEVCLELLGERPIQLPFFTGYISRGLLLHILRRVDPSISSRMHESDVPKPYSVTPIRFRAKKKLEAGYIIDPSAPCMVCFRFLRGEIARRFLEYFHKSSEVMIYDAFFHISSIRIHSEEYGDIWKSAEPAEAFRLHFITPTYLSVLGTEYHYLFPDHTRIFPNLLRLWNMFSDTKRLGEEEFSEYREWLLENMGVSQHRISTRIAYMGEKKATGFTGWATYEMKKIDEWNRLTCALAKYAEYSNIGGNRTGGFGVTKMRTKI